MYIHILLKLLIFCVQLLTIRIIKNSIFGFLIDQFLINLILNNRNSNE
jgi:hypothetical protein